MELTSAQIKNLESHHETTLDFVPGINIITGDSASGKSAILRALDWGMNNTNQKNISHWNEDLKKESSIKLNFKDATIIRKKHKTFNGYILDEEKELDKIGTTVPDKIASIINMGSANFSFQHDPYFLLSGTSGATAKYLNSIINLDVIDNTLAKAQEDYSNTNKTINSLVATIKTKEEELQSLSYLDVVEPKIKAYKSKSETLEQTKEQLDKLKTTCKLREDLESTHTTLIKDRTKLQNLLIEAKDLQNRQSILLDLQKNALEYLQNDEALKLLRKQVQNLETLYELTKTKMAKKIELEKSLNKIKEYLNLSEAIVELSKVKPLEKLLVKYKELYNKKQTLDKSITKAKTQLDSLITLVSLRNSTLDELEDLEAQKPETCPTCGTILKGEKK